MDRTTELLIAQLKEKIFQETDLKKLHILAQTLERLLGDVVLENN